MVPVSLIVLTLISRLGPVRYLIVSPSQRIEVGTYICIFLLYIRFTYRSITPLFRVESLLEHIDTGMGDEGESIVKFSYILECFSRTRVGKSEDEVDIYRQCRVQSESA